MTLANAETPSATLSWLATSERERKRAIDALRLTSESEDTIDQLGLGTIRDGLAELMFPGVTTGQTRAAYFLLVPWLYTWIEAELERGRSPSPRDEELDLIPSLMEESSDNSGVIGIRSGRYLTTLPSELYWQGLGSWGIRQVPWRRERYHGWLLYGPAARAAAARDDEKEPTTGPRRSVWCKLPPPPSDFPSTATLDLRFEDSTFLVERLESTHPNSLLYWLASRGRMGVRGRFVWAHPNRSRFRAEHVRQVDHAQVFSEVMHGPRLLYNLMLAEKTRDLDKKRGSSLVEQYTSDLSKWASSTLRPRVVDSWSLKDFWELLAASEARVRSNTRNLVRLAVERVRHDPATFAGDADVRAEIARQERRVKGPWRARLSNPEALKTWTGASGTGRFDFRWHVAWRIVDDIRRGAKARPD